MAKLINKVALEMIKATEDCELKAYPDPLTGGLPWTIGWGITHLPNGQPIRPNMKITQEQADKYLEQILADYTEMIEARIPGWPKLNLNQQGAILSFAWNCGATFYGHRSFGSITALINKAVKGATIGLSEATKVFELYRNPGTVVEDGLRKRRQNEAKLFVGQSIVHNGRQVSAYGAQGLEVTKQQPIVEGVTPANPDFSLVSAFIWYKALPHQKAALNQADQLFAQQPELAQALIQATQLWRQSTAGNQKPIRLQSAAASWKNLPHQQQAIQLLDTALDRFPQTQTLIAAGYRGTFFNSQLKPQEGIKHPLATPYISQMDQQRDPYRMCNVTSVGMVIAERARQLGSPLSAQQLKALPDQLDAELARVGRDRYTHINLDWLLEKRGIKNEFTTNAAWEDIKAHLDRGFPVIHSGRYTGSGHIVVLIGYDDEAQQWIVNDPYGEWFSSKYKINTPKASYGHQVRYSYNLLNRLRYGANIWAHYPSW